MLKIILLSLLISAISKAETIYFDKGRCAILKGTKTYPLKARVKIVTSFADFKVKIVKSFPDLQVRKVKGNPSCCEWVIVESFPDFTVQLVDSHPDFTVQFVESLPCIK